MKQIDFGKWFHVKNYQKILYKARNNSNFFHDLFYISSYIHDAECFFKEIRFKKNEIIIPINRLCWELFEHKKDLLDVKSNIIISNVEDYYYQFPRDVFDLDVLNISDIYRDNDTGNIIISNNVINFKITIKIKENKEPIICLEDVAVVEQKFQAPSSVSINLYSS